MRVKEKGKIKITDTLSSSKSNKVHYAIWESNSISSWWWQLPLSLPFSSADIPNQYYKSDNIACIGFSLDNPGYGMSFVIHPRVKWIVVYWHGCHFCAHRICRHKEKVQENMIVHGLEGSAGTTIGILHLVPLFGSQTRSVKVHLDVLDMPYYPPHHEADAIWMLANNFAGTWGQYWRRRGRLPEKVHLKRNKMMPIAILGQDCRWRD